MPFIQSEKNSNNNYNIAQLFVAFRVRIANTVKKHKGEKRIKKYHIKRNIMLSFHYSNSTAFLSKYVLYANTLTQTTRRKEI